MPRRNFNDGQELTYQDINAISSALERGVYDRVLHELVGRTSDAFFGDSLKVSYVGPTQVSVAAGLGIQSDNTQVSPEPVKRPIYLSASQTLNITSPHASLGRIDIVCVKATIATELTETRKFKDEITEIVSNESLVVQKDWVADLVVTAGTPHASPVAPAVPTGYIKIAELTVTAITGMSGSGAVSDKRTLMPIGSVTALNTLGYVSLTAAASTPLSTLMGEVDELLRHGKMEYLDVDNLGGDPSNPASGKRRIYIKSGVMYFRDNLGNVTPVGSGGGGGGVSWYPKAGYAPIEDEEYSRKVMLFEAGGSQKAIMMLKVPSSYLAGRQINVKISAYSPSSSNTFLLNAVCTLIRNGTDAVDSTTNQRTTTNAALTNTVAKMLREITLDVTSSSGAVNAVAVNPGDMLIIELTRQSDTDTADVRFIPEATEITLS